VAANLAGKEGRTPVYIMIAATFGHASAIEALGLLEADADRGHRADGGGRTPVYAAAMTRKGHAAAIGVLGKLGADANRAGARPGPSESAHRLSGSRPAAAATACLRLAAAWWPSPGVPPGPATGRTRAGAWAGSRQGHWRVSSLSASAAPCRRAGPGSSHAAARRRGGQVPGPRRNARSRSRSPRFPARAGPIQAPTVLVPCLSHRAVDRLSDLARATGHPKSVFLERPQYRILHRKRY
jgi:hypothetical protein